MSKKYVITLTAANRVGILAAVTRALEELGGDLEEVNVSVLQRFFTIILAADFPKDLSREVIRDHLKGLGRPYGLEAVIKDPEKEELAEHRNGDYDEYLLSISGRNQPGMIKQVSSRLAQDGIDIKKLYAIKHEAKDSPFTMELQLHVPIGIDPAALPGELEILGQSAGVSAKIDKR